MAGRPKHFNRVRPDYLCSSREYSAGSEVNIGCEYSADEREFLMAMDRYKRLNRRPFPTWQEVLAVVHSLGYRKVAADEPLIVDARQDGC